MRLTVTTLVTLVAALLATLLPGAGFAADPERPPDVRTFVIVVDGLFPDLVGTELTPTLAGLIDGGEAATYTNATAGMVTETNGNHVMMMTGLPGQAHGLFANSFYNRATSQIEGLDFPRFILAEHLFDAFAAQRPDLTTAGVMGKEKLRWLFDCTRGGDGECGPSADNPEGIEVTRTAPDFLLGSTSDPAELLEDPFHHVPGEPASGSGVTKDDLVMNLLLDLDRDERPDFTFVNLGEVDGWQHIFGARSPVGLAAIMNADLQIGRLVDQLRDSGDWERTVVIVTSDHSFTELDGDGDAIDVGVTRLSNPVTGHLTGSRIVLDEHFAVDGVEELVAHGGSASIYLEDPDNRELAAEIAQAALELRDNLDRPAVAGAFCRLEVEGCEGIPAAWGLDNARVGEVLLTTGDQHIFLRTIAGAQTAITGHHGGPASMPVPLIVASGGELVRGGEFERPVTVRDIAPTVGMLHGIVGADGLPFPGVPQWSRPLDEALAVAAPPVAPEPDPDPEPPLPATGRGIALAAAGLAMLWLGGALGVRRRRVSSATGGVAGGE